jgi:hypothetical protein
MSAMTECAGYLPGLDPDAVQWSPQSYGPADAPLSVLLPVLEDTQITDVARHVEPPLVCRRLITSSHATISNALNCA